MVDVESKAKPSRTGENRPRFFRPAPPLLSLLDHPLLPATHIIQRINIPIKRHLRLDAPHDKSVCVSRGLSSCSKSSTRPGGRLFFKCHAGWQYCNMKQVDRRGRDSGRSNADIVASSDYGSELCDCMRHGCFISAVYVLSRDTSGSDSEQTLRGGIPDLKATYSSSGRVTCPLRSNLRGVTTFPINVRTAGSPARDASIPCIVLCDVHAGEGSRHCGVLRFTDIEPVLTTA
ncbi:uncharacterized protein B0H18DRAFT_83365 [Fomitopsis serialis]|uniref:uncharacterized protein n=1 Tax=Fomitopsis serialis TaxID=139415 RepID=UPI002008E957|nr:uncharacterized protein B0H18DRAFT_83365 [Neoantrodia serialis]KAH9931422.1 hypothetical protein B0H18DRAFT_83365 [Neoantrodia serialis]